MFYVYISVPPSATGLAVAALQPIKPEMSRMTARELGYGFRSLGSGFLGSASLHSLAISTNTSETDAEQIFSRYAGIDYGLYSHPHLMVFI